ncbi:MAG: CopD family protein, partial [Saprospiraceae bacterium]
MLILYAKVIHIIGFVAWFAGLFYLVRMFVYNVEADDKPKNKKKILQDQYHIMQWRVYKIIVNPAMMITWTAGLTMLYLHGMEWFKVNFWMHSKLLLLIGL